ncbi:universal stress protein [Pedobacter hiemivivus]|uniref:Universal stress protein n=1 Tax=Pedobacter hiemivivus TaxID=2530454 RepID=A0A4U1GGI4_9SPHI|nr:universal stress protein [Pedobacter hiemivivus]TKC62120.1 universal stress protein [Pedobacter hiemivivus]
MKTLLLLTDFSTAGNHSAEYGYNLAKVLNANVILCNAVTIPAQLSEVGDIDWPLIGYDGVIDDSDEELKKLKKHFEHTDRSSGFHPQISTFNQTGRLADVVENVMQSCNADMVVMGTHRKGIAHFLLDNNCRNMINATSCPLLLIPPHAVFRDFGKIAFATNFEYPQQDIEDICKLIRIANIFRSDILVTHIHAAHPQSVDHQHIVDKLLTGIFNKANYPNIFYKSAENEHIGTGLNLFCEDQQIGLLVMVHRPHDFLDIILKGSHTQQMAANITIPLLVLPDGNKSPACKASTT